MAAEENKQTPTGMDSLIDEEGVLKEFDLGEMAGVESAGLEDGRPLPKKVELDIDDMLLGEEEEEPEPSPDEKDEAAAEAAAAAAQEDIEKVPARISRKKLAILAGAALLLIITLGAAVIWMLPSDKPLPPEETAAGLNSVEMEPFLIDIPANNSSVLMQFKITVAFSTPQEKSFVEAGTPLLRDAIFRFVQSQANLNPEDSIALDKLQNDLTMLLRNTAREYGIKSVRITDMKPV